MNTKILKVVLLLIFIFNPTYAKSDYFQEGIYLFETKKYKQAKFKFEQEILFNPKSELSYLYLSKIFKNLEKKNEEATFILAKLKLDSSDYKKSKELNERLNSFCKDFCSKSKKLKIEIENLSKK